MLSWRISNTADASFCVAALEDALARFGKPEIFNTDQGSQFTSAAFTGALTAAEIKISMDGRGRWMDNVFVERLWRSLKHEDFYLKGYADGIEAKAGLGQWIEFYNNRRLHQSLGHRAPMAVWREGMAAAKAVDMMDNAAALTTCPQQQQQTEFFGCVIKEIRSGWRPIKKPNQPVPLRGSISLSSIERSCAARLMRSKSPASGAFDKTDCARHIRNASVEFPAPVSRTRKPSGSCARTSAIPLNRGGVSPCKIPDEGAPQFLDDGAPRNGMIPPPNSEMKAPPDYEMIPPG